MKTEALAAMSPNDRRRDRLRVARRFLIGGGVASVLGNLADTALAGMSEEQTALSIAVSVGVSVAVPVVFILLVDYVVKLEAVEVRNMLWHRVAIALTVFLAAITFTVSFTKLWNLLSQIPGENRIWWLTVALAAVPDLLMTAATLFMHTLSEPPKRRARTQVDEARKPRRGAVWTVRDWLLADPERGAEAGAIPGAPPGASGAQGGASPGAAGTSPGAAGTSPGTPPGASPGASGADRGAISGTPPGASGADRGAPPGASTGASGAVHHESAQLSVGGASSGAPGAPPWSADGAPQNGAPVDTQLVQLAQEIAPAVGAGLEPETVAQVLQLRQAGASARSIQDQLGVDRRRVSAIEKAAQGTAEPRRLSTVS